MGVRRRLFACGIALSGVCLLALPAKADEIRLKDGKKLYGVIVAYEDNMFKVKTDFGYVLVEKDKIASIIPAGGTKPQGEANTDAKPNGKKAGSAEAANAKSKDGAPLKAEPAVEPVKDVEPAEAKREKAPRRKKTAEPANTATANLPAGGKTVTPTSTPDAGSGTAAMTATRVSPLEPPPPAAPKEPQPPAMREEVQGNTYINHTYGFQMYKAPSWGLLEDARRALPNAIVAMGTSNQATVMVVGQEKTNDSLAKVATAVEKRLREAYENYRRLSEKETTLSGLPALGYRYRGKETDHDWSGTLVVLARGKDIFTVLGATYADDDLIQIQENVIARAIASLSFSAQ